MDEQNLDLDPQQYLRALQVDATTMVAIIWSLASAAFRKPEGVLARKLEQMRDAGRALEEGRRTHETARGKEDPRPFDLTLDHAWAAMIARLQAWAQLPEADHAKAQAGASRLLEILASDGLAALSLPVQDAVGDAEAPARRRARRGPRRRALGARGRPLRGGGAARAR
jgi:hypothetical protein